MSELSKLNTQFEQASEAVQDLAKRPDNETLLKLYAFYKQGAEGDAKGKRPGFTSPVKRAKFDAWKALTHISTDEAKQSYIDLVNSLL